MILRYENQASFEKESLDLQLVPYTLGQTYHPKCYACHIISLPTVTAAQDMHVMPIWRTLSHFIQVPSALLALLDEVEYRHVANPIIHYSYPQFCFFQWINLNEIVVYRVDHIIIL